MADDPRDTGRAGALTSSGPALFTASSSSSPAHASSAHRLPQSRFSFEFHYPLRKRALTASHHASHAPTPLADDHPPPSPSVAPDLSPTPQRTLLYDRPRRSVPSLNLSHRCSSTAAPPSHLPLPQRADAESAPPLHARSSDRVLSPNATKRRNESLHVQQSLPNVKRRMPSSTVTYSQGRTLAHDRDRMLNGLDNNGPDDGSRTPIADDARSKNEDIFLNIARSDSTRRESLGRSDLRRSRFRMSGSGLRSPGSRVNNEQTPSPDQLRLSTHDSPLHLNNGSPSTPYSSLSYPYSASAHPLDDHSRSHHSGYVSSSRSTIGLPRSRFSRTSPDASPHSPETNVERRASLQDSRGYRHSSLSTIRSVRQTSTSEATERARQEHDRARHDGTESTLSTNAPSTVWDELEDLKSRIKKLELTGKLPPSSQEAISASVDRPRTATTTVTTLSSSPRHGRKTSAPSNDSDTITVHSQIHPLLQSALAKAKDVLSKEVYSTLEVTVMDALALSSLLNSGKAPSGSVSVVNGGYGTPERYSRRKADSVCRSLTELCLALTDEQLRKQQAAAEASHGARANHIDEGTTTPTLSFSRSTSQEPETLSRRQSIHVPTRLESRRMSLATINGNPSAEGPQHHKKANEAASEANPSYSPGSSTPANRLSRLSTSLRTKRLQNEEDNLEQRPSHMRSLSRSMTDIGSSPAYTHRVSPRQRPSQLYTPSTTHEPPPEQTPRFSSQSLQTQLPQPRTPTASHSGLPLRRSLATPSYTPATSRSNIQAGSRRYGLSSAGTGGDGANDVPFTPSQEPPSHTRISASSKLASSYTPITQNRLRTNSLGARKFGFRQRPLSTLDNGVNSLDDSID